jgi:hypothetical protein
MMLFFSCLCFLQRSIFRALYPLLHVFGRHCVYVYIVTYQPIAGLSSRTLLGSRPVNKISAQTR